MQNVLKYYTVVVNKDTHEVYQASSVRTRTERNPALTATAKQIISAPLNLFLHLVLFLSCLWNIKAYLKIEERKKNPNPTQSNV